MTTYHFDGAVAYDRLGSSWRTAAGLRSVTVTDPATGLLPANLKQSGLAVLWLTADANYRYSFTCDVPGVVVDFGAGAEALYANEVPGLAIAAGGATTTAIDARMKWAPLTVYTLGQQVLSPNNDVVSATAAHTSGATYTPANWTLSSTYARVVNVTTLTEAGLTAAATTAGVGGTVVIPPGVTVVISNPVTLTDVSLVGSGSTSAISVPSSLGSGIAAITLTSASGAAYQRCGNFTLTGPGVRSLGVKTAICDGIAVTGQAKVLWIPGLKVWQFDSGLVYNNSVGHLAGSGITVTDN